MRKACRVGLILGVIGLISGISGMGLYYTYHLSYLKIPRTNHTPPVISGTFIQYTGLGSWTYQMWDTEFANLHAIGIDTIILQWVHTAESNRTLYQSQNFEFEQMAVSAELFPPNNNSYGFANASDVLTSFFTLAEKYHLNLHIGLTSNWEFGESLSDLNWVTSEIELNRRLVTEILQQFGTIPSFQGFYIPYEIYQDSSPSRADAIKLGDFFGQITSMVRDIEAQILGSTQKTISIAPYVSAPVWAPAALEFWTLFWKGRELMC